MVYGALYQRENESVFLYAVMLPMWASYIVKAYAWTLCWQKMAWLSGFYNILGWNHCDCVPYITCGGRQYAVNFRAGRFLVFLYIWLPFMILPVQAGLSVCRRHCCRRQLISAHVHTNLSLCGAAAGDPGYCRWLYFTFSLTLGDFIVPQLVGPPDILSAIWFIPSRGRLAICRWGGIHPGADCSYRTVPGVRETLGAFDAL